MQVDLYYLSPNPYGGWVTFTAHLMAALRAAGCTPYLYKIGKREEKKRRPFGYGEEYRNVTIETARKVRGARLIVAAAKKFREETEQLLGAGACLVVHDPTELKNMPDLNVLGLGTDEFGDRVIVIREIGLEYLPHATFIPHPYQRMGDSEPDLAPRSTRAISTSRIDFDKNTTMILDANRILASKGYPTVDIRGFENRIYTRFKVVPEYPEWEQSKAAYPRDRDAAFNLLKDSELMVDMSIIKGDGGGTQYTTLEAWDAGAVPVIHGDWLRSNDEMRPGANCISVEDAKDLAWVVSKVHEQMDLLRENGYRSLNNHDPLTIGNHYREILEKLS